MNCITILHSIFETSWSIELKIYRNALWHVIQAWYKFRWSIFSSIKDMRDKVFSFIILCWSTETKWPPKKYQKVGKNSKLGSPMWIFYMLYDLRLPLNHIVVKFHDENKTPSDAA